VANSSQARKRARQNVKRRTHNMSFRTKLRTYIKKVIAAIQGGNKETAREALNNAQPVIDAMVTKGILHKNKAARHKSRLNHQIKEMSEQA